MACVIVGYVSQNEMDERCGKQSKIFGGNKMLNSSELRSFMNDFMRQKLFFSPEHSRLKICSFFEYYTRSTLNFDEKLELIQAILDHGKEFITLNCVADNANNELEHVLSFKVDPVDNVRWNEFVSNF